MGENRIIEIWNKIDLLKDPLDMELINKCDFPVVPMSALYKTNLNRLEGLIEDKINIILGKKYYIIKNGLDVHGERLKWLYK